MYTGHQAAAAGFSKSAAAPSCAAAGGAQENPAAESALPTLTTPSTTGSCRQTAAEAARILTVKIDALTAEVNRTQNILITHTKYNNQNIDCWFCRKAEQLANGNV
ncbi:uncharacterized protein C8A04DRAFT_28538 [Dichotomopilus funicola]|uniref:Uncharacterized protein n=1 Tax=Dichotomopilus funicola TaxID=1934379 RepID=A0AAN6ZN33_9PEZI|nr:hypothetical protein C8A04DRAFT_28538 [Dichotomopilus funicola]